MTTQDEPVEDGSTQATDDEKIRGILEQTRQDVAVGTISPADVDGVLEGRFADSGIAVDEQTRRRLWAEAVGS